MVRLRTIVACCWCFCALSCSVATGMTVSDLAPLSAIGYENDFGGCGVAPVRQEMTSELGAHDGAYAPRLEPCVLVDYFATGLSQGYLDAISLSFDLSSIGPPSTILSMRLRVYLKKGAYPSGSWHAAKVYPNAFSTTDQDCDSPGACWSPGDEFPGDPGWEGWIERDVPVYWVTSSSVSVSLRLWNAKVDAIVLQVTSGDSQPGTVFTSALGFEDDFQGCGPGPTLQDVFAEVAARDGLFAPRAEECVYVDYFANGGSQGWLDAISAHFDLSVYSGAWVGASITLRAYVRKGPFSDNWHALKLYPGPFNPQDQGCDSYRACWAIADEFPGTPNWEGWVERSVPAEWVVGDQLDVTMRFWNARVDAIELLVDAPTDSRRSSWGALKARYAH